MAHETREKTLNQVRHCLDMGDPAGALAILEPYLKKYDGDGDAHALAGTAYLQVGKPWKAETHFKHSLAIWDKQYEISITLLRLLMDRHKWGEALELAERLRRENPNDNVLNVMLESCKEHYNAPPVGWERDENKPRVQIEFTGEARKKKRR